MNHLKFLTLFFLLSFCLADSCLKTFKSTTTKITDLQTGHFSIQAPSGTNKTRYNWYRMPFVNDFSKKKQKLDVALCTSPNNSAIIYINGYQDSTGVDFIVKSVVNNTYFDTVFVINVNASWIRTHIHYIASARSDLKTGSFTIGDSWLYQTNPTTKPKKNKVSFALSNTFSDSKSKIVPYIYISGIKCFDQYFILQLSQADTTLVNNTIYSTLSITNNTLPIQFLSVSYFAYNLIGQVSVKQFPDGYDFLFSTLNNSTTDDYGMNGMTAVKGPWLQQKIRTDSNASVSGSSNKTTKRLLTIIDSSTSSGISANQLSIFKKAFEIQQLDIISNQFLQPILRSTLVSNNIQKIFTNNICISYDSCIESGGQMTLLKNDSRSACVLCAPNKTFNSTSQQCECLQGYILLSQNCVTYQQYCGKGSVFKKGACYQLVNIKDTCPQNNNQIYDENTRQCICKANYSKNINSSLACSPICPTGSSLNLSTNLCQCQDGSYFSTSGQCIKCSQYQTWNSTSRTCCCKVGTSVTKSGACLACSPYAQVNFQKSVCECKVGYVGNGLICRALGSAGISILGRN